MHEALVVRRCQPARDLNADLNRLSNGQAAHLRAQRLTLKQLGDDEELTSCNPVSKMARMLGWDSDAIVYASRSKRARRSGSEANVCGRTLIATSRLRRESRAL